MPIEKNAHRPSANPDPPGDGEGENAMGDSDSSAPPGLTIVARVESSSNVVFLCCDSTDRQWAYKPVRGERPLWDFPQGTLAGREVAAYLVSEALEWDLVPPTFMVEAAAGTGMAQHWLDVVDDHRAVDFFLADQVPEDYLPVVSALDGGGRKFLLAHCADSRIRQIAIFDAVINNADRKGGHILIANGGTAWAIDHGLAFHDEPKLRTVLWGWAGEALTTSEADALTTLKDQLLDPDSCLSNGLADLISHSEVCAVEARIDDLLAHGTLPLPGFGNPLPWPVM